MSTWSQIKNSLANPPKLLNSKLLILSSVLFRVCRHQKSSAATGILLLKRPFTSSAGSDIKLSTDHNFTIVHFLGDFLHRITKSSSNFPFLALPCIWRSPSVQKITKTNKWPLSHRIMQCDHWPYHHHHHYQWGHAGKYLTSCLSIFLSVCQFFLALTGVLYIMVYTFKEHP